MRIVGGSAGGRRIVAPSGSSTRPTSDRVREALFNILGPPPEGIVALDLFAGAGALGLEALSRGVAKAVFVDSSKSAVRTLRKNIDTLGFEESSEVHSGDALRALDRFARTGPPRCEFHWVFVDPPYAGDLSDRAIDRLGRGDLLGDGAVLVVEHDRRSAPAPSGCLVRTDERRYGDTVLSFFKPETHER